MSYKYERTCDFCGKVTRDMHTTDDNRPSDVDLDAWHVSVSNHWWSEPDDKGLMEIKIEREIDSLDACRDCSKEIADLIRKFKASKDA